MAAHLNVRIRDIVTVVLYEDDSVEAWFTDGARISLSACAATFTRQEGAKSGAVCGPPATVHQFTRYAARECRERLGQLIRFRNYFAERPYVCDLLLQETDVKASYGVLQYAAWPASLAQIDGYLHTSPAGGLRLVSGDGVAWAELAGHGQTLTTCHLTRLHQEEEQGGEGMGEDGGNGGTRLAPSISEDTKGGGGEGGGGGGGGGGKQKRKLYVWTTCVHSTAAVPECWRHALSLLLQYKGHTNRTHPDSGGTWEGSNKENHRADAVVSLPLPHSLPLACPSPQLHYHLHPSQAAQRPAVKVMLMEGTVYHVIKDGPVAFVEALPNQNTVLRSRDQTGRFFDCWSTDSSGSVQHNMCCTAHPPPSRGGYSTARVLGQAARLLQSASVAGKTATPACWKHPAPPPSPPLPPLRYSVPGLGQFTARSNGHIRCVFPDHTTVDCYCPALQRGGGPEGAGGVELGRGVWLGEEVCRVMLPNGRYQMVSTQHPSVLSRYIKVVRDWCEWLRKPEEERGEFYEGTVYDQQTQRHVLAELSKIQRFDAVLSGKGGDVEEGGGEGVMGDEGGGEGMIGKSSVPQFVQEALKRTTEAVKGIDTILRH